MTHDQLSDDMKQVEKYLQELQKLPTKPLRISTETLKDRNRNWTQLQPDDLPELKHRKNKVEELAEKTGSTDVDTFTLEQHNNVGYRTYAKFGEVTAKVVTKATGDIELTASTDTIELHKTGEQTESSESESR